MVLFIDHHADGFIVADGDAPGAFTGGVLFGNEVTFDQELAIELVRFVHIDVEDLTAGREMEEMLAAGFVKLGALQSVGFGHEGIGGDIAGQADPGADDDFMLRARVGEPFAGLGAELVEVHGHP